MRKIESMISLIRANFRIDAIYLYGSRAKGNACDDSDWDLAVLFTSYEHEPLERMLRAQRVEELLEQRLHMYNQISVVDLESVPPGLQMNIIMGRRVYDRLVPHVRKVEYSILSKMEKDYVYVSAR